MTEGLYSPQEGDYLIGAPGSLDRRGSMHKNHVPVDLFDQPRWYDYPVVDGSPQENATLDDYLGLYFFSRMISYCFAEMRRSDSDSRQFSPVSSVPHSSCVCTVLVK